MNPFGITTQFQVHIAKNAGEAVEKGFTYHDGYTPLEIKEVVVVQDGTIAGFSTVDLVMVDKDGNKFATCLTGGLLKAIPC